MSVHHVTLPSGAKKYQVRWREGQRNRSRNFPGDKAGKKLAAEFDRKLADLRQAGELANELARRRTTILELGGEWLDRVEPTLARKTAQNYALQLDSRVMPQLGARRVAQLTVADVERWISWMRANGDGDATILKACTVLQALLTMAVRDGVVPVNVAQQARKPHQGRKRIPYLIRPEQVEVMRLHMVRHATTRDVVLLELLAYAGLRPESEAVMLPWSLVRAQSLIVKDTKRKRERSVTLLEPLRETLKAWRRESTGPLVAPTHTGRPWSEHDWRNWRRREFRRATDAAGLPADVRPRDLRGSFVSLMVHEGRSIVEVATQVGHSPAICLRDYAQVFADTDPAHRVTATEAIRAARAFALSSHVTSDGSGNVSENVA